MKKQLLLILVLCGVLLVFAACSSMTGGDDREHSGAFNKEAAEYYNGFYGISVAVPEGWYVYDISEVNLQASPDGNKDYESMEKDAYDGGEYIKFIEMANVNDSAEDNHVEFDLYADYCPDYSLEDYLSWNIDANSGNDDGYEYTFKGQEKTDLNGQEYQKLIFNVLVPDFTRTYTEEYYITETQPHHFIVAYINYWDDTEGAKEAALEILGKGFMLD